MKALEREIRCKRCKRLLMKGEVWAIEIKCPKCGVIQYFHAERDVRKMDTAEHDRLSELVNEVS